MDNPGWNSQPTATVMFDDCVVSKTNILGGEEQVPDVTRVDACCVHIRHAYIYCYSTAKDFKWQ